MADEKAIEKVNPAAAAVAVGRAGVALNNLDELLKFATMCVQGKVAPKGMDTPAQAAIAIQAGMERGLGPLGGLQAAIVINGVLSWRGWAAVGFIQNSGVCLPGTFKSWTENPASDKAIGWCRAQRRGYDQPFVRSFSVADAKKAGLWQKEGPWRTRPDNMLEWRAIGDMGRFHFGDVLGGFPIAEDVEAGGVGPAQAVAELAAERLPEPPPPVKDPVLAELVPQTAADFIEAVLSHADIVPPDPTLSARAAIEILREQAAIDKSVDEAFPPPLERPGPQNVTGVPLPPEACSRCKSKLNAMAGCDVCGWPGPDNGERPVGG